MSLSLNNVTTGNDYATATTLGPTSNVAQITVVVANAAVYMQIATGDYGQENWTSELLVTPSSFTLTKAAGVRFRSALAGTPAQVIATAWLVGDAQPLGSSPFTQNLSATGAVTNVATAAPTYLGSISSAATITPAFAGVGIALITGTTQINKINQTNAAVGNILILQAYGQGSAVPVVFGHLAGGGNIVLSGGRNFGIYSQVPADAVLSPGESLTFYYDGTNWTQCDQSLRTVLDHQEITANVPFTATTDATANTLITGTSIKYDGATPIDFEAFAYILGKGTTYGLLSLYEDAASVGIIAQSSSTYEPVFLRRRRVPSAAIHTASLRGYVDAGTGTLYAGGGGAGSPMPAYLRTSRSI